MEIDRNTRIAVGYMLVVLAFFILFGFLYLLNSDNRDTFDETVTVDAQRAETEPGFEVNLSGARAEDAIEEFLDVRFRAISNTYWAERGNIYRLRFDATPDRLRGLLRGSPRIDCPEMTLNDGYQTRFTDFSGPDWWFDALPASYAGVDCVSSTGDIYRTLVDNTGATWAVYMEITLE